MTRARRQPARAPWPFGSDTRADRLAVYLRMTWEALVKADPAEADRIRRFCEHFGDDHLIQPPVTTAAPGERWDRHQVAALAGVDPKDVTMWGSRGISRGGRRYYLRRGDGGFLPDDVTAFLRIRDTPDGAPIPAEVTS